MEECWKDLEEGGFDLINEGSHSRRAATVFACSGNILPRHPPSSLSYKEIR